MSRYSLFLDIAGRVSETDQRSGSVTSAVVAIPTDKVEMARSKLLPSFPKWSRASPDDLHKSLRTILDFSVSALVMRVEKKEPAWSRFWAEAHTYRERFVASNPVRAKETNFTKAANVLKYWLFGEPAARVIGECIRREGAPRILDSRGRGVVDVSVVCDKEIQGGYNVDIFKYLWENLNGRNILSKVGMLHHTRTADLVSEEDEPLLLLPDHLAGIVHTRWGGQEVQPPENFGLADIEEFYDQLEASAKFVFVRYEFDLQYQDIFGSSSIGKELWSAV